MILGALWPMVLLIAGDGAPVLLAQSTVVIRRTLIVRVPAPVPAAPPRPIRWKTRKGPKCLPSLPIAGAAISGPDRVDIIFRGGMRIRAELEDECPALDYYRGFYMRPGDDGRICADRDPIRARSGGECRIERFRTLVPVSKP